MRRAAAAALALLLLLGGCAGPVQPDKSDGPLVYTDWSKLDAVETAPLVGERWYDEYTGELIPHEYGTLVPYAGLRLAEGWPADSGCLYGLMTIDGVAVTDPVYSDVYHPGYWDGSVLPHMLPVLVLVRGKQPNNPDMGAEKLYALAAEDGSWCTEFEYAGVMAAPEGLLLLRADGADWVTLDGTVGTVTKSWTAEQMGLTDKDFQNALNEFRWGEGVNGDRKQGWIALCWADVEGTDALHIFRPADGAHDVISYDDWHAMDNGAEQSGDWDVRVEGNTTVLTRGEETVTIDHPAGEGGVEIGAGVVVFRDDGLVYNMAGEKLFDFGPNRYVTFEKDKMLDVDAPGLVLAYSSADAGEMEIEYYLASGTKVATAQPDETTGEYSPRVSQLCGIVEVLESDTASYYETESMTCIFRTRLSIGG
ncbi:MAG: hypothetical protein HFF09_01305 [Oscillospiraceae bacterium]|nr:hypothetical protein [Oscillospiraceae bacterium]